MNSNANPLPNLTQPKQPVQSKQPKQFKQSKQPKQCKRLRSQAAPEVLHGVALCCNTGAGACLLNDNNGLGDKFTYYRLSDIGKYSNDTKHIQQRGMTRAHQWL